MSAYAFRKPTLSPAVSMHSNRWKDTICQKLTTCSLSKAARMKSAGYTPEEEDTCEEGGLAEHGASSS